MHSVVVGPEALFITAAWWVVAAVIITIGWRRRNRVLLIVGALLGAGAMLSAVQLYFLAQAQATTIRPSRFPNRRLHAVITPFEPNRDGLSRGVGATVIAATPISPLLE
jgi:hypothetical protein